LIVFPGQYLWLTPGDGTQVGFYPFQMRDQAAGVSCSLMQTEANHLLPFGTGLQIAGWLGQRLLRSPIFLHAEEGGIFLGQ
jgi:hypothetical protein